MPRTRFVAAALVAAAGRFFGFGGRYSGTSGGGRALGGGRPAPTRHGPDFSISYAQVVR